MTRSPVVSLSNFPPRLSREEVDAQISRLDSIHAANTQLLDEAYKRLLAIAATHAAVIAASIAGFDALFDRSVLGANLLPEAIDMLRKAALVVGCVGLLLTFFAIANNYGEMQRVARQHASNLRFTLQEKRLLRQLSSEILPGDPRSYLRSGVAGLACLAAIFGLAAAAGCFVLAGIAGFLTGG
ncbi:MULTISPECIES: hypothetical protein [unclassified Ensifer]|uniref:hypothetical protein n=1 Tax=unclassified Ensifer TaxID=2633371 RepID=UPI0008133A52|nr:MULTISPECIES: hypothetical protein [unclassified Ensifer]OCP23098.1 hypothetical protein BC361_23000 [Ensifer sp. LC54]OCP24926.1 hypothetical protein BC363_21180 [Ensifer sp. LC384]